MTKTKVVSILNLVTFLMMIAINVLATIGLLGNTTAQIANDTPNLMMPIGMTFQVIWTLIYALLLIYTVYQLVKHDNESVKRISIYYLMTNILNIAWIASFHANLMLISTVIIIGLLASLYVLVRKMGKANRLMKITFNIYYAWITVASVVSIFSLISSLNTKLYDSLLMRLLTIGSMVVLVILTYIRRKEFAYTLTILFAMIGIIAKHNFEYMNRYPEIVTMGIIVVILGIFISLISFVEMNSISSKKLLRSGAK